MGDAERSEPLVSAVGTDSLCLLQVSTADAGGGAERIASDLHVRMRDRGATATLAVGHLTGGTPGAALIPNDANRSAWARAVLHLEPGRGAIHGRQGALQRTARRVVKSVAEPHRALMRMRGAEDFEYPGTALIPSLSPCRPDVLHLHNLHGSYFDLRRLPELTRGTPTVLTAHDTWLASGHCAYALDCGRWLEGCGECPTLWTPVAVPRDRTAQNLALKHAIYADSRVHLVGPSTWVLRELERSAFAEAVIDATHIPNGVDQRVFAPAAHGRTAARRELGIAVDALVLVFNAAVEANPYKDFATVRAALPHIVSRVDRPVVLLALGGFPEGETVPGATVVSVAYSTDPAHVATHLQAADLAIHAALAENHPLAILEAQSCGVAVVASDVGGVPETMRDGQTGLLVPPKDPRALADAVVALLTDDARREAMGAAALAFATGRFGIERMADDYAALYERIRERR